MHGKMFAENGVNIFSGIIGTPNNLAVQLGGPTWTVDSSFALGCTMAV